MRLKVQSQLSQTTEEFEQVRATANRKRAELWHWLTNCLVRQPDLCFFILHDLDPPGSEDCRTPGSEGHSERGRRLPTGWHRGRSPAKGTWPWATFSGMFKSNTILFVTCTEYNLTVKYLQAFNNAVWSKSYWIKGATITRLYTGGVDVRGHRLVERKWLL